MVYIVLDVLDLAVYIDLGIPEYNVLVPVPLGTCHALPVLDQHSSTFKVLEYFSRYWHDRLQLPACSQLA